MFFYKRFFFSFLILLILALPNLFCSTSSWNGVTGFWGTNTNWTPNTVPNNPGDQANFPNGNYTVTADISPIVGKIVFNTTSSPSTLARNGANVINFQEVLPTTPATLSLSGGACFVQVPLNFSDSLTISGSTYIFSSPGNITGGSSSGTLTVSSTLILPIACTYSGATNLTGSMVLNGTNILPSTTALTLSGTINANGAQSIGSLSGSGTYTWGPASILTTGNDNTDTTFSGRLTGGAGCALLKVGTGTFTLSGTNSTYAGGTTVSGGALAISTNANIGTGNLTLNNNTALKANGTSSISRTITLGGAVTIDTNGNGFTISSNIGESVPSSLTKISSGTLTLSGTNTYSLGTALSNGTLAITTDANIGSGTSALTLGNGTVLQANGPGALSSHTVTLGGSVSIDTNGNNFSISTAIAESSVSSLAKTGNGTLTLSGTNTYSLGTTLSNGTLAITSDANLGSGTSALTLGGGTVLQANGAGALSSHPITLADSATIDTNGNTFTISTPIGEVVSSGSTLTKINSGTLILGGANSYTGGTHIIAGTLRAAASSAIPSSGLVTVDSGAVLDLNNFNQTIGSLSGDGNISLGSAKLTLGDNTDQTYGGIISDSGLAGSLTKQNLGTLNLTGANTYTGNTDVTGGTLLVNGSIQGGTLTVSSGATLGGEGTINAAIINSGAILPGNSIGTLSVTGPVTFDNGSTYEVELNPISADLLDVTGTVTINPGATIKILPDFGMGAYKRSQVFTVIQTTGGRIGMFGNVDSPFPSFIGEVNYDNPFLVQLIVSVLPFSDVVKGGNPGAVAAYFDSIMPQLEGSDLDNIIEKLQFLSDTDLRNAFDTLHPAIYKALATAQQTTESSISSIFLQKRKNIICHALEENINNDCEVRPEKKTLVDKKEVKRSWSPFFTKTDLEPVKYPEKEKNEGGEKKDSSQKIKLWIVPHGNFINQNNLKEKVGFNSGSGLFLMGTDFQLGKYFQLGFTLGYSYTDLKWKLHEDRGNINSFYEGFYGSFSNKRFFADLVFMGAFNKYKASRNIAFSDIKRQARRNSYGGDFISCLNAGAFFKIFSLNFIPWGSFSCIHVTEAKFTERGADSVNLAVKGANNLLLRSELGINISKCFCAWSKKGKIIPLIKAGYVNESRIKGRDYTAHFIEQKGSFKVKGLYPDRNLADLGVGVTASFARMSYSVNYDVEFEKDYLNNKVDLNFSYSF